MTNEEKAREIAANHEIKCEAPQLIKNINSKNCYNSALQAMRWKDEQTKRAVCDMESSAGVAFCRMCQKNNFKECGDNICDMLKEFYTDIEDTTSPSTNHYIQMFCED